MSWRILQGDARATLEQLPERSVQTCVTSPPYFGLRDYGTGEWDGGDPACDHIKGRGGHLADSAASTRGGAGKVAEAQTIPFRDVCGKCGATRTDHQIGLEGTVDEYVAALVDVFRAVRRVLRDDGTVWLNLGDSYAGSGKGAWADVDTPKETYVPKPGGLEARQPKTWPGIKAKDLIGVPWRVAFALQADGWWLRSEIIWAKPNPMPESVTDRPTRAHEQVFLLAKQPRYYWDADAIREENDTGDRVLVNRRRGVDHPEYVRTFGEHDERVFANNPAGRNKRSVWSIATQPYAGAHFATFPAKLIEPCILAGSPERTCGVCGAPWVRVTQNQRGFTDDGLCRGCRQPRSKHVQGAKSSLRAEHSQGAPTTMLHDGAVPCAASITTGFEPSCDHHDDTGRALVLDPFAGSGTTGVVALRHNRSFIGCELNGSYVDLATRRILDDAPLLNSVTHEPDPTLQVAPEEAA